MATVHDSPPDHPAGLDAVGHAGRYPLWKHRSIATRFLPAPVWLVFRDASTLRTSLALMLHILCNTFEQQGHSLQCNLQSRLWGHCQYISHHTVPPACSYSNWCRRGSGSGMSRNGAPFCKALGFLCTRSMQCCQSWLVRLAPWSILFGGNKANV